MEESKVEEDYVYRISTPAEWEALQRDGSVYGVDLDKSTGCFHLSTLSQVQSTLQNFFLNIKGDLYLLQVDAKKLGEGLVYEEVDGVGRFPHYYGPSRTFSPLPLEYVVKAEKLSLSDGDMGHSHLATDRNWIPPKLSNKENKKFVLSMAWSPDGRRIACCSMDGTISIFDVTHAKFLHHLEGHFMPVTPLLYSPVKPWLLFMASDDAHVHMYDAEGKALAGAMTGHGSWIMSIDVIPDGTA